LVALCWWPAGAAVGATVGAVAGGIATICVTISHVRDGQRHPSYRYENDIRVGADLPSSGVIVKEEYGVTKYRYTVVNDRTVLVDPGTHRIVEIID
jgi:hypothetical protein